MKSYDTVFSRYIQKLPLVNFVFISILKLCTLLRHIMKTCHEASVMVCILLFIVLTNRGNIITFHIGNTSVLFLCFAIGHKTY